MIPEPRLNNLYQEVILDHNKNPRNFKEIHSPTCYSHGVNPLCGDDYHLYLSIQNGVIEDVGFQGSGCAISKSSASLMTTLIKGKTPQDAARLGGHVMALMTSHEKNEDTRAKAGKMVIFEGVRDFPVRVKCATLIWHALNDALKDAPAGPQTEGEFHE
ncbi:MAG: SUF system NifU family Fe-S cluster assembly protein [Candidatus Omnitrophica bacterium]|nr:SUF system NifU family Fe-S cluster assembly protein [Candidatus Omnitrophota bacterium]